MTKCIKTGSKVGNEFVKVIKSCESGWINTDLGRMLYAKVRMEILESHGEKAVNRLNDVIKTI